jgi:hypothetical protein
LFLTNITDSEIKNKIIEANETQESKMTQEPVRDAFSLPKLTNFKKTNTMSHNNPFHYNKQFTSIGNKLNGLKKLNTKKDTITLNSPKKENFLNISSEDEIFSSPEVELKLNLIPNQNLIHNSEKQKKIKDRKTRMFNAIYKIDEEFIEKVKHAKSNKNLSLLDYQNNLVLLFSDRICKENLRKLSVQLRHIRDTADKIKSFSVMDWGKFEEELESARSPRNKKNMKQKSIELTNRILPGVEAKRKETKLNTNLNRIAPFLPDFLVEKFKNSFKIKN